MSEAPKREEVNQHFATLNRTISKMNYGRISLPTGLSKSPEPSFAARIASKQAVDRLQQSLSTTMSIHSESVFVAFVPSSQELPAKRGFVFQTWLDSQDGKVDGFFAVVGDHTQLAVNRLHSFFPRNPLWKFIPGQLLLCRRSVANLKALKSWGVADNQKGETRAVTTFKDKLFSIHRDIVEVGRRLEQGLLTTKQAKTELKGLKADRIVEYGSNTNSMGQLWGIAQRSGAVWDAIERIMDGKVHMTNPKKRFVPPNSAAPFTSMGGIPDADLAALLGQVLDGKRNMKDFTESCKRYKATARVQQEILDHAQVDAANWEEAQSSFPTACDAQFVSRWVQVILSQKIKQKHPMPGDFHRALGGKVEHDLTIQGRLAEIDQVPETTITCSQFILVLILE